MAVTGCIRLIISQLRQLITWKICNEMFCNFDLVFQWQLAFNWHLVWYSQWNISLAAWASLSLTKICSRPNKKHSEKSALNLDQSYNSWNGFKSKELNANLCHSTAHLPLGHFITRTIHHTDSPTLGQSRWWTVRVLNCPGGGLSRCPDAELS